MSRSLRAQLEDCVRARARAEAQSQVLWRHTESYRVFVEKIRWAGWGGCNRGSSRRVTGNFGS